MSPPPTASEPDLISAMHATMAATARPCTRAGCSLPGEPSFSTTDTQPTNTKKAVPSSSARHGWNALSKRLGLAGGGAAAAPLGTRDAPASHISIFSSAMAQGSWVPAAFFCARGERRRRLITRTLSTAGRIRAADVDPLGLTMR